MACVWDVFDNEKKIDTIFTNESVDRNERVTAADVKRHLVENEGYPERIVVREQKSSS